MNYVASFYIPIWNSAIDRADSDCLRHVFADCRDMFTPGDYFVGYFNCWRVGSECAARYAHELGSVFRRNLSSLPMGSDDEMEALRAIVVASVSSEQSDGFRQLGPSSGLSGPLAEWGRWLARVLSGIPTVRQMYESELEAVPDVALDSLRYFPNDGVELYAGLHA